MTMHLTRRQLLQRSAVVGTFGALTSHPLLAELARAPRLIPWRNWSGAQSCLPLARLAPKDLDELVQVIRQARARSARWARGIPSAPWCPPTARCCR
ncbi:hypothetical protein TRE132_40590 [Pseudomonas chlororaphis subsp. aurantiaca]|nr:hypothetical protein TRE132_40590 [Pseudomonas chlororaphis subsp. aurantiaca]